MKSRYILVKVNVVKQTTSTVFCRRRLRFESPDPTHVLQCLPQDCQHLKKTSGRERIYTIVGYICRNRYLWIRAKITQKSTKVTFWPFTMQGLLLCYVFQLQFEIQASRSIYCQWQRLPDQKRKTMDDLMRIK